MHISQKTVKELLQLISLSPGVIQSIFDTPPNNRLLRTIWRKLNGIETPESEEAVTAAEPALLSICVNGLPKVSRLTSVEEVMCYTTLTYVAQNTGGVDPPEVRLQINSVDVGTYDITREGKNTIKFSAPVTTIINNIDSGIEFKITASLPESQEEDGTIVPARDIETAYTIPFVNIDMPLNDERGLGYYWTQEVADVTTINPSLPFVLGIPYTLPEEMKDVYLVVAYKSDERKVKDILIDGWGVMGDLAASVIDTEGILWNVFVSKRVLCALGGVQLTLEQDKSEV